MTHKLGSFYDPTTAAQTFINLLHPDLIANGWVRIETNLDVGPWRWEVYHNPAANNLNAIDFYIALGRYYSSGTAGTGNANQTMYVTVFEQWNSTTNEATNFPVWGVGVLGTNASGIPTAALTPRSLPNHGTSLQITSINVTNPGSGYTTPPNISVSAVWQGTLGQGTAVMELSAVTLGSGGSGYPASQSAQSCTVTGGGGTGAIVTAATNGSGVVTSYTIVNRGTGYTSVPTVTVDGGGVGATSTVTLRVKEVTVTNPGSGYNCGATIGHTGGGGGGATFTATVDSGFAWHGLPMGQTSTQYFYTVTNNMVAYSFRRDGVSDSGGVYAGTYERMLSAAADPMPIGVISLISSSSSVQPTSGYGFSTREPVRGAAGGSNNALLYDCALCVRPVPGGGALLMGANAVNPYTLSNSITHEMMSADYFNGRGQYSFPRGILKDVVYTPASSLAHGDLLFVQMGSTIKYARYVNAGHALMIV